MDCETSQDEDLRLYGIPIYRIETEERYLTKITGCIGFPYIASNKETSPDGDLELYRIPIYRVKQRNVT